MNIKLPKTHMLKRATASNTTATVSTDVVGISSDELLSLVRQVSASFNEDRDYADPEQRHFSVASKLDKRVSAYLYANAPENLRKEYTDDQWTAVGSAIETAVAGETTAAHDEQEDVTLALQAIAIVRELLAREASDGSSVYELNDLVSALSSLYWILMNEQWDAESEAATPAIPAYASETSPGGDDDMTPEQMAELSTAVATAVAGAVTAAMAANTEALIERLKPVEAVAAVVEEQEVETEAEAAKVPKSKQKDKGVDDPDADDTTNASVEVAAVVEEQEVETEAEAAKVPKSKQKDKGVDDPDADDTTNASVEEDPEEILAMAGISVSGGGGGSSTSLDTSTKDGRARYLEALATKHKRDLVAMGARVPVGKVNQQGEVTAEPAGNLDVEKFLRIFRR